MAAVAVFGKRGYEGASTRDIARTAGVNAPAIHYYFDGKEGVYLQCIELLIKLLWQKVGAAVQAAENAAADEHSNDGLLIEAALGILAAVLSTAQDTPQIKAWRAFFDRHQAGSCPQSATAAFEQRFKARIEAVMRLLIGRLSGLDPQDDRAVIHAMALLTQGLAFRAHKAGLLAAMNWTEVNHPQMEQVKDVVLTQARFTLEGLALQRATTFH
ncbi:CerR family C-terminal domain-containing protein [Pseudomonas sp. LP_7_YM]|uniref:CerR family C-terminal domain-containing protein n=1 Tax=Pseudomonas sp. LP_7_YM TaxID=2485137 RepID=UPI00211458FA|nr:CerR family C-terminal domain-containing protein [Pseudomonas sp. LP_7_YM]